jgi:hypothetical protein
MSDCLEYDVQYKDALAHLLEYLLKCVGSSDYRKFGSVVYEQMFISCEGRRVATQTWRPAYFNSGRSDDQGSSLKTMVHHLCRRCARPDMWSHFMNIEDHSLLYSYLENCDKTEFPSLRQADPYLFSFKNGMYWGRAGAFYSWEVASSHLPSELTTTQFYPVAVEKAMFARISECGHIWSSPVLDFQVRFGTAWLPTHSALPPGSQSMIDGMPLHAEKPAEGREGDNDDDPFKRNSHGFSKKRQRPVETHIFFEA